MHVKGLSGRSIEDIKTKTPQCGDDTRYKVKRQWQQSCRPGLTPTPLAPPPVEEVEQRITTGANAHSTLFQTGQVPDRKMAAIAQISRSTTSPPLHLKPHRRKAIIALTMVQPRTLLRDREDER